MKFSNKKPYIKPIIKVTDKNQIISYAKTYIADNNFWVDMNSFIWKDMNYPDAPTSFIFSVSTAMEFSGKYKLSTQDKTGYYIITPIPKKSWKEKYWVFVAVLGFIIGWFADIAKELYLKKLTQDPTKSEQSTPIKTDSSRNIRNDSSKHYLGDNP